MKRVFAVILAAALLSGLVSGAFASGPQNGKGNTVYISNEKEFLAFADSCRLDTWSAGKTVILTQDIELSSPLTPIPTFSGTLYGKGHSISGLELKGKHGRAGLFGILTKTALVKDLTVSGRLKPTGTVEYLGGIAAVNDGIIMNCSFSGSLEGDETVGGIAGCSSGIISGCTADASVSGMASAGGICGRNDGKILNCTSECEVNLHVREAKSKNKTLLTELKEGDLKEKIHKLLTIEQAGSTEDIGGIAGYSTGTIDGCSNTGSVGKEGIGFNVGGIAGTNCGYITGCSNTGKILGKEYVGGIAGIAEPSIAAVRDGDPVDPLRTEINSFLDLINDFTFDMEGCADDLTGKIGELAESIALITDNLAVFEKEMAGLVNGKISEVNDIKGLAADALGNVAEATDGIKNLSGRIQDIVRYGTNLSNLSDGMVPEISGGLFTGKYVSIDRDVESCDYWAERFGIEPYSGREEDRESFISGLNSGFVGLITSDVSGIAGDVKGIADSIHSTIDSIAGIEYLGDISPISNGFNRGFSGIMLSVRHTMEKVEELSVSIDNLLKVMSETVRVMTGKVTRIVNGLFDAIYDFSRGGFTLSSFYYSEDNYKTAVISGNGVISSCSNSGTVRGRANVGGIAGGQDLFGIPEFVSKNSRGLTIVSFCYTDLIQHCVNTGDIVAELDCAGLITGKEDMGAIYDCRAYGTVQSRKGSCVGGIAGLSNGTIEDCFVKAALRAEDYAGGIAGSTKAQGTSGGSSITDCVAQIEIYSEGQFVGGISGTEEGKYSGNIFVNDGLNGVDDFSISGKAEPGELSKLELPGDFETHEISSESRVRSLAGTAPLNLNFRLILILVLLALLLLLSIFVKYATFFIARKIRRSKSEK